jgi:SH3-like domain-containing protein
MMLQLLKRVLVATFLAGLTLASAHAGPLDPNAAPKVGGSGLPIPRFASLGSNEVNMRTGPGEQYPIDWRYVREGIPVEVIAEFGNWRKVRDPDGTEGWILGALLSEQRTGFVIREIRTLYAQPTPDARAVFRAAPGVIGKLVLCEEAWCQLSIDGRSGWILRDQVFGAYPGENFN